MSMELFVFPVATVIDSFLRCNTAGQWLVVGMMIGSVFAWSIMVTKFTEYHKAQQQSERFRGLYQKESNLFALSLKQQSFDMCPLYEMYKAAYRALAEVLKSQEQGRADDTGANRASQKLNAMDIKRIRNVVEQTMDEQIVRLEENVVVLATAVTAAPFVGLLGSVWGVMDAFGSLSGQVTATLSQVAPGVSGSLLTTIVGLVVALPSLIGYNMLASRLRIISRMMEHFVDTILTDVERYGAGTETGA